MKKNVILVLTGVLLCFTFVQCKSKEDKALAVIKDYFFNTMADFNSYQPIETIIDSAFQTCCTDRLVLSYANDYFFNMGIYRKELNIAKNYLSLPNGNNAYEQKKASAQEYLNDAYSARDRILDLDSVYYSDPQELAFLGWKVTHKYRCRTNEGLFDVETADFIIDEKFKEVLFTTVDEQYKRNIDYIRYLLLSKKNNTYGDE